MPTRPNTPFIPTFRSEETSRRRSRRAAAHDQSEGFPWKRTLDVGVTLAALPVVALLICVFGLWVKMVSKGPAFFKQQRIGRNGRVFTLYKLRSMEEWAPAAPHRDHVRRLVESRCPMTKLDSAGDSRFIRGGRFLRSSCLDELPQLFNVLAGEMSLVGPRPCLPYEYRFYSGRQRRRFDARPGLTGYWQVAGRNRVNFRRMAAMDLYYARNTSLWLDLAILSRTPAAVSRQMLSDLHRHADRKPAAPIVAMTADA